MSSSPTYAPTHSHDACPVAIALWLRRAARRLDVAGTSIFESANNINDFLRAGRSVGGLLPQFAAPVSGWLKKEVDFESPRSGHDLANIYRKCAVESVETDLCEVEVEHVRLAESLEVDVEGRELASACDVLVSVAVAMDVGDRNSSLGAQAARIFARGLRHVQPWVLVVGWRLIAKKLGAGSTAPANGVVGSLMDVAEYAHGLLGTKDRRKVGVIENVLSETGFASAVVPKWRNEVVGEWVEMLGVAKRLRAELAAKTYSCITHHHTVIAPAKSRRCSDPQCMVHHIGMHASDQFERVSLLVRRLETELEILSKV